MKSGSFSEASTHPDCQGVYGGGARFNRLRRRLERIAYCMLGSTAEAEDVVQDTWLRWHSAARQEIENEEAWLVSVTRRLSIDRLRANKIQRERSPELWCSGAQVADPPATPQDIRERADDVSMAYLILLERLSHEARAAFLMREVFDADYVQIARTLQKAPEACRQLVSRAKAQLHSSRPHFFVPPDVHHHLLGILFRILEKSDSSEISAFLAVDAALTGHASMSINAPAGPSQDVPMRLGQPMDASGISSR